MAETGELKQLPLHHLHVASGARFGAFAGWSMPITYPAGVMKEHLHTREHAGLFDISHMRLFDISGPGANGLLARACPIEPNDIGIARSKYTFFLDESAGILDDLIVTRLAGDRFILVANAGNAEADEAHLRSIAADFNCTIDPLDRVFLALQGPETEAVLTAAGLDLAPLAFMQGVEPRPGWFASRSGYTGEDGFELAMPPGEAEAFAGKLLADERVIWIGLAARDSLRLEGGLCLHGQDIDPSINPVEARLMWAIPKSLRGGGSYIGSAALAGARNAGAAQRRVGLMPEGRQPVRAGATIIDANGEPAGRVTSGGFGPSAGAPVAMGYVRADLADGSAELFAEVRGNRVALRIHPLPFTPHRYRKG